MTWQMSQRPRATDERSTRGTQRSTGLIVLVGVLLYLVAGFLPYFSSPAQATDIRPALGGGAGTAITVRMLNIFQWIWPMAIVALVGLRLAAAGLSNDARVGTVLICASLVVTGFLILLARQETGYGTVEIGFYVSVAAASISLLGCLMASGSARSPD